MKRCYSEDEKDVDQMALLHPHIRDSSLNKGTKSLEEFVKNKVSYVFDAVRVATKLIKNNCPKKYEGMTVKEVVDHWNKGSANRAERQKAFESYVFAVLNEQDPKHVIEDYQQGLKLWLIQINKMNMKPYRVAWEIHGEGIISKVDLVCVYETQPDNKVLDIHLVSLTREKHVSLKNNYKQQLQEPFQHLPDTVFHQEVLRLAVQQYILEKYYTNLVYKGCTYQNCRVVSREIVGLRHGTYPFESRPACEERINALKLIKLMK